MQKAQSRNLISGLYEDQNGDIKGFRADIIHSGVIDELTNNFLETGSLVVRFNDLIINTIKFFL